MAGEGILAGLRARGLAVRLHGEGVAASPAANLTAEDRACLLGFRKSIRKALVVEVAESVFGPVEVMP